MKLKALFDGVAPSSIKVSLCDGREVTLSGNFEIEVDDGIYLTRSDDVTNYNLTLERYNAIYTTKTQAQIKQERINELKAYLVSTDYIYNSLREEGRPEGYYDNVIAQRKLVRREIQELEGN